MKKFYCNGKKGYCDRRHTKGACKNCKYFNGNGGEYKEVKIVDHIRNFIKR